MFTLLKSAVVVLVVVLGNSGSVSAQNLFADPGFEIPAPGSAQNRYLADSTSGIVWKTSHPSAGNRTIEFWANSFNGVPSAEGKQHIETSAYSRSMVFQSLALTPGQQYDWSFCHRGRSSTTIQDVAEFRIGIPAPPAVNSLPADPYYYSIVIVSTSNNGATSPPTGPAAGSVIITTLPNGWVKYSGTYTYPLGVGAPAIANVGFLSVSSAGGNTNALGNFIDDARIEKKASTEVNCNCCPGENPLTNGDFEDDPIGPAEPPVWPGITSQYAASNLLLPGAPLPGQYSVVNGTQALNICSNWELADHCTCLAPGKFMVVNGRTGQTGSKSIWQQTVAVTAGEYKFCAFAKNLPQCCFDVQPKIEVKFSGVGIGTSANIAPTVVNMSGVPCRWQLITTSITVPSGTTSLTIDILLDETGQGDGNDLALDDISFQLKPPVPANYVTFGFENPNFIDATHYTLTANYPPNLPLPSDSQNCGYFWEVCQLNEISSSSIVLPMTTVSNPFQWWTFPTPTFNDFNGYDGTSTFPGIYGTNPGVFETGKYYRVTFGVWCDCQAWRQSSLEFRYNVQLRKLEVSQPDAGSVPEVKVERRQKPTVDSKLEQANLQRPNLQRPKFEPRPEPKPEMKTTPIDESKLPREGAVTTRVGEFISYKDGNLTLNIAAKPGDRPKATVFERVTAVAIDPLDPLGMKKLPAEEVFSGMKVGTTVNVMTNKLGEFTFSVAYERARNPKPEMKTAPIDESKLPREGAVTTRVGEFISYRNNNLTLAIAAKTGDEPKATVFPRVTAIAIDPLDPLGMKKLPAEEVFSGMKVGTTVNVMTNKRGEFTFSVAYERAPNPKLEMKKAPIDESKLPRANVEPKPVPETEKKPVRETEKKPVRETEKKPVRETEKKPAPETEKKSAPEK